MKIEFSLTELLLLSRSLRTSMAESVDRDDLDARMALLDRLVDLLWDAGQEISSKTPSYSSAINE